MDDVGPSRFTQLCDARAWKADNSHMPLSDEQRRADLAALGLSKLKQRKHASTQLEALIRRGEQSNPPIALSECVAAGRDPDLWGSPSHSALETDRQLCVGTGTKRLRSGRQRRSGWPRSCHKWRRCGRRAA